jgi:UDP-N-acetylglucosamine transferase subunit ALG13
MGYRVKYSRKKYWLPLKLVTQFPRILYTIYREHRWLARVVKQYSIDAVISDNRFGMYCRQARSIYITHQLLIKTGNSFTERIAKKIHYYFIKKYNECWVPDFDESGGIKGLAGELSHQPLNTKKFIGALSRFEFDEFEIKYDLLIVISGPEPQRSIFEKLFFDQLKYFTGKILMVRGLPGKEEIIQHPNIEIHNHLPAEELNKAILQSALVISRCGYTTVMDLVKLKKKAILVPTPGQTEQEYLAGYLMKNNIFYTTDQKGLDIRNAIKEAASFPFNMPGNDMEKYKEVIAQFVQSL